MSEVCERGGGKYYVRIDNWHPTRLNKLINSHWATRNRLKNHDAQLIALSVRGAGVPDAERKRRVSLEITLAPRQRAGDPDAYWKCLLDALVHCRALRNDSHHWCELGSVTFIRGERMATVIVLEDIRTIDISEYDLTRTQESERAGKRVYRIVLEK